MKHLVGVIAALLIAFSASTARAEQACDLRTHAVVELEKEYKETVSGRGLTTNGYQMVELFVSKDGSWTILATDANGRSCLLADGQSWQGITTLPGEAI